MDISLMVLLVLAGLLLIFLSRSILEGPIKYILKLGLYLLVGAFLIWIFNLAGNLFDFKLALNPATAFIAGFLQIPGIILLAVLTMIF